VSQIAQAHAQAEALRNRLGSMNEYLDEHFQTLVAQVWSEKYDELFYDGMSQSEMLIALGQLEEAVVEALAYHIGVVETVVNEAAEREAEYGREGTRTLMDLAP